MEKYWSRWRFPGIFYLAILLAGVSCSQSHRLAPLSSSTIPGSASRCAAPFVTESWQFIHSIEAKLAMGGSSSVIGVTNVYPERKVVHCVIMTLEGFVLFDATYDQEIHVDRKVPPFESEAFAEGLMKDITLIFFKPSGEITGSAMSENGSITCRYEMDNETVEDVRVHPDKSWDIHQYEDKHLKRSVSTGLDRPPGMKNNSFIPSELELTAYGEYGYSLRLRLIEARRLTKNKHLAETQSRRELQK